MKQVYIRMLDGEVKAVNPTVPIAFYKTGMAKIVTFTETYLIHASNVQIIADEEEELDIWYGQ